MPMTRQHRLLSCKTAKAALVLLVPLVLVACLHLDLGTVLSLRKMDPYSVDLVNSRAAVLVPDGLVYNKNVDVSLRMHRGENVLEEQKFELETLADGEDLPGIDLATLPLRPVIIRLAKADFQRANDLQKRLGALDQNHQWVEPDDETVASPDEDSAHRSKDKDAALAEGKVQGDLGLKWGFSLNDKGRALYCEQGKTIRLTAWVKLNDSPVYQRVIHGLPLKRFYGKAGIKAMCAQKRAQADGPAKPKDAEKAVSK